MQLIISPNLSGNDIDALLKSEDYIHESNELIENELMSYLEGEKKVEVASELFFQLIINNVLEVKIAIPENKMGIFHEKIALFYLKDSVNKIAIIGSNNETFRSVGANHESFNTFCSWKDGQLDYVLEHEKDFEETWNNKSPSLNVYTLKKAVIDRVLNEHEFTNTIEENFKKLKEIAKEKIGEYQFDTAPTHLDFTPYDFQKKAAEILIGKNRGILEFATGSGKTKTAIYYMELLKSKYSKNFFVIVVPDKTLLLQWEDELQKYNDNIVTCYSGSPGWVKPFRNAIDIYNTPASSNQVIVVTNQTMFRSGHKSKFLKQLRHLSGNYTIIVDEVHNWSTKLVTDNLPNAKKRVALSATPFNEPKSHYDKLLNDYFGGIAAEYTLENAIKDNNLVPYNYIPIFVELSEQEKVQYNELTRKIMSIIGANKKKKDKNLQKMAELLSFSRARIVYGAENKLKELEEKLKDEFFNEEHLLIYCGATSYQEAEESDINKENEAMTKTQVQKVNDLLANLNIKAAQYTQTENKKDRENALELFKSETLSTLVAIKCLDEGVNIPEIKSAIILASSTNKREFIQRRGRVLRKSLNKDKANIYDFIVYDPEHKLTNMNNNERIRFFEFARLSLNFQELMLENAEYMEGFIYE